MASFTFGARVMVRCLYLALLLVLPLGPATAAEDSDFDAGWAAYQRGEFAEAFAIWEPLADGGNLLAQYNLGVLFDEGRGVSSNRTKAMQWLEKAAQQGYSRAQHNLALLYIGVLGPERDPEKGRFWLERAASKGFPRSQYTLGKMFLEGLEVDKDETRAFELFLAAGRSGFVRAQYNLGKMYRDGAGTGESLLDSLRWFRRAAEQGYAKAQEKMALRYYNGSEEMRKDLVEAMKWSSLASRQGRKEAGKLREKLLTEMSPEEIEEGERRADLFIAVGLNY